jgi:twitching motility protein PilT
MPPREETLMGRIAVQAKMITMDQLAHATHEQGRGGDNRNLGQVFLDLGMLTPSQLERLLQLQKNVVAKLREREAVGGAPTPAAAGRGAAERAPRGGTPPAAPPARPAPNAERAPTGATAARTVPNAGDLQARREARSVEPGAPARPAAPAGGDLDGLLRAAIAAGASDVHVHAGAPVRIRCRGRFVDHGSGPLDPRTAEGLVMEALSPDERRLLAECGEVDFCYCVPELGRFRGNAYRQLRGTDAAFRIIPERVPTLGDLGLPNSLARLTNFHQGMVLVTGPARCGKTSTLAALVDLVNEERAEHILTIEDPIEYLHPSKRCLVNQRKVRRDTESFARALRGALREDPDVIVIGELRDTETISLALTAAETGHLVLATLHTDSAIRTVERLVGAFPPSQQSQVRTMISESLRAVVSQRLLPSATGEALVPALEVLIVTKAVGKLIRDAKTFQIHSILQTGSGQGMCLLDQSLQTLVQAGTITRDEARRHCSNPKLFGGTE